MNELNEARIEINQVDKEMAELFKRRMNAVKKVAHYKQERGLPVLDEAREAEVIQRNAELFEDDELRDYYVSFIKSNMKISRRFQKRLIAGIKVAYSGVPGAFANIAAEKIFPNCNAVNYPDFSSAYNAVVKGDCECVVLPIENSYNGDVGQVTDLTFFGDLYINGVYEIDIVQNLLAKPGTRLSEIKEVISHPQALGQCAEYIKKHGFKATECVNTAVAAKLVSDSERMDLAAIASQEAAEKYDVEKIDSNINESNKNTTRFAVFSRTANRGSENDSRFIMLFTVKNEVGSLSKAVSIIGDNGFNMQAIKSRPTKELVWDYYFYVECEGEINSPTGEKMISELNSICSNLKIAGSFPKEILLK